MTVTCATQANQARPARSHAPLSFHVCRQHQAARMNPLWIFVHLIKNRGSAAAERSISKALCSEALWTELQVRVVASVESCEQRWQRLAFQHAPANLPELLVLLAMQREEGDCRKCTTHGNLTSVLEPLCSQGETPTFDIIEPLCSQGEMPTNRRTTPRDVPGSVGDFIGPQRAITRSRRIAKRALPRCVSRGVHCLEHTQILRRGHYLHGQVVWSGIKEESQVRSEAGRVRRPDRLSGHGARFLPFRANADSKIGYTLVCCSSVVMTKNGRLLGIHEKLSPTSTFVYDGCLLTGTMVDGAFLFSH
ncbi:hypothetical protein MRX96_055200 [Rhipicephalus microplus]